MKTGHKITFVVADLMETTGHYKIRACIWDEDGSIKEIIEQDHPLKRPFEVASLVLLRFIAERLQGMEEVDENMPDCVTDWLKHLRVDDAEELWKWLDETPNALHELIEVVAQRTEDG